jgi:signal transduction histidine kinase
VARTTASASPLAPAALALVEDGASAAELEQRFAEHGAPLRGGVAARLLSDLAHLGLVRVARGTADDDRRYVLSSLGQQLVSGALTGGGAVPLEELERLRTDLLSTIAHELRTPLTAVRTSAGLLLDPSTQPTADQQRAMIETIGRNADRMQRLVGDILDLARYRSGAIRLQLRPFDAAAMAQSVVNAIAPLVEARHQAVELAVDGSRPRVFGDHRRLEQALVNLVSNAQRFTPDGGRISVSVGGDEASVRWAVTDEGPGIPAEDQPRLFERFFVGGSQRNDRREGVGLGLPTALAIAQAHGGTIEVDSRPGGGSTFALVVPTEGPGVDPG